MTSRMQGPNAEAHSLDGILRNAHEKSMYGGVDDWAGLSGSGAQAGLQGGFLGALAGPLMSIAKDVTQPFERLTRHGINKLFGHGMKLKKVDEDRILGGFLPFLLPVVANAIMDNLGVGAGMHTGGAPGMFDDYKFGDVTRGLLGKPRGDKFDRGKLKVHHPGRTGKPSKVDEAIEALKDLQGKGRSTGGKKGKGRSSGGAPRVSTGVPFSSQVQMGQRLPSNAGIMSGYGGGEDFAGLGGGEDFAGFGGGEDFAGLGGLAPAYYGPGQVGAGLSRKQLADWLKRERALNKPIKHQAILPEMRIAAGKPKSAARSKAAKSRAATNPWLLHVKEVRSENPGLAYKDVLKLAKKSY